MNIDHIEDTRDEYDYGMKECCENAYRQGLAEQRAKIKRIDEAVKQIWHILNDAIEADYITTDSLREAIDKALDILESTEI